MDIVCRLKEMDMDTSSQIRSISPQIRSISSDKSLASFEQSRVSAAAQQDSSQKTWSLLSVEKSPVLLIQTSHVPYEWAMSHFFESCPIWMSPVPYAWVIIQIIHMGHDSFIWDTTPSYGTWLIHMGYDSFIWDMTDSYGTWLIHMGHDLFIPWYASFIHAPLITLSTHDMPHAHIPHSYGTWLLHMGHDSFIWDMTHSYGTWLVHTPWKKTCVLLTLWSKETPPPGGVSYLLFSFIKNSE